MIWPIKICPCRVSKHAPDGTNGTDRDDEDRVHARPRCGVEVEDGGCQRDLLELPHRVDAEADDDHRGDVQARGSGLDRIEDDLRGRRDERGVPRDHAVDEASEQGRGGDAAHAYETEEADDQPMYR